MDIILMGLFVASVVALGVAIVSWRATGIPGVFSSAGAVALVASLLVGDRSIVIHYALLSVVAVLSVTIMATASREVWRAVRIEAALLGSAVVLVVALTVLTAVGLMPRGMGLVLLGVLFSVTAAAIVISFVRLLPRLHRLTRK